MKHLLVFVSLAALSACDSGRPWSTPTAPSPSTPTVTATPPGAYTISGVVFEVTAAGRTPLDADLYCDSCGEVGIGHTFTHTDANGFYTFTGVSAGVNPVLVSKEGFQDPLGERLGSGSPPWYRRQVTVVGDTRFDIELVRK